MPKSKSKKKPVEVTASPLEYVDLEIDSRRYGPPPVSARTERTKKRNTRT